jgi:3-hydroxyisobutyrate dehydrogenase-like beta-hydroxyacid dehydrogenase
MVVFDPDENNYGVVHGLGPDGLLIDMGTTSVLRTRGFADRLRRTGAEWLDAPVSGGTVAAENGTLTIMTGGGGTAFHRALPLFRRWANGSLMSGRWAPGKLPNPPTK